jgi:hypothetical protein
MRSDGNHQQLGVVRDPSGSASSANHGAPLGGFHPARRRLCDALGAIVQWLIVRAVRAAAQRQIRDGAEQFGVADRCGSGIACAGTDAPVPA